MQRRLALTLAGSGALVLAAGTAAVAANLGILGAGSADDDPVGDLDAGNVVELISGTSTTSVPGDPVVVYVDEYVTVPGAPATSAGSPAPAPATPSPAAPAASSGAASSGTTAGSRVSDDDHRDDIDDHDDELEDHDDEPEEHEDEFEDHDDD